MKNLKINTESQKGYKINTRNPKMTTTKKELNVFNLILSILQSLSQTTPATRTAECQRRHHQATSAPRVLSAPSSRMRGGGERKERCDYIQSMHAHTHTHIQLSDRNSHVSPLLSCQRSKVKGLVAVPLCAGGRGSRG